MSGNGARVVRSHSLKDHVHTSDSFTFFLVLESSILFGAHLEVMSGWGEAAGRIFWPRKERGKETFQKHSNALLTSKETDTRIRSGTVLLGSMCGDSVKNVCFTGFSLPLLQEVVPHHADR